MKPEDVRGVYDNCIAKDRYLLRRITWKPRQIIDIGANVGMFTLACRVRFPEANIIAVEPVIRNFDALTKQTALLPKIHRVHAALATGPVYRRPAHVETHSHAAFVGPSFLYPEEWLRENCSLAAVAHIGLRDLVKLGTTEDLIIKIDTEGAEDCLVDDDVANVILREARYVAFEVHFYSPVKELLPQAKPRLMDWVSRFSNTHVVATDTDEHGGHVWMMRRD